MPVTKGDQIVVPAADITKEKITIKWSQSFSDKSQDYYMCKFTNSARREYLILLHCLQKTDCPNDTAADSGVIFIQADMLDSFKGKKIDGAEFTVNVDDSFQYGQESKDGTKRWLCFHNKKNTPYQVSTI